MLRSINMLSMLEYIVQHKQHCMSVLSMLLQTHYRPSTLYTQHHECTLLQGRHYVIESEIDSSADRDAVMDVLTDYPNHSSVFSSIQSSRVVARNDHEAEVLQVLQPFDHYFLTRAFSGFACMLKPSPETFACCVSFSTGTCI